MTTWPLLSIERPAADAFEQPESSVGHQLSGETDEAQSHRSGRNSFIAFGIMLFLLHAFCMLYRYGQRPPAPVIGDEVTINDPAVGLSRGLGLVAPSFRDSIFGLDRLYAHFPPVYIYLQSLAFRFFGVSVYSLRLTATITDLCAAAAFLWILYLFCRWRLADWRTASIAALLYTLNASVIALHRIARMEPLIELLCVLAVLCVLAGTVSRRRSRRRSPHGQQEPNNRSLVLVHVGCALAGLSMATHPEALTAVLPLLLLVCLTSALSARRKLAALAVFVATPVLVWLVVYGRRSVEALHQMWTLVRFTPGPGLFSFAHDFTREDHRNISQGMRATLFVLCVAVLAAMLLRWLSLERAFRMRAAGDDPMPEGQLYVARSFALAIVVTVVLLVWVVGASVSRYEVMYPVYLLGLVLALRGISAQRLLTRTAVLIVSVVVAGEMIATGVYLFRAESAPADSDPRRFDLVLSRIPRHETVAATPMLWLAFQQQHRPFTLLYWRFDGRAKWARENGGNPLRQFDAVVIDESFVDDYQDDTPYAAEGRVEQRFVIGSDVVHLYLPQR